MNALLNFIFYNTPVFYLIQSLWRDEAFSYFMAKPNLARIIINTAHDFNPPLYYILLHFWIYLVGHSDEGLRILSFLFHIGTVYVAYKLAEDTLSKRFAPFVATFTFLNPMLLYYAFEIRMYSLYAFLTIWSFYLFYKKNWKWYIIITVFGLYTHSFFPLIVASYALYLYASHTLTRKNLTRTLTPILFFLPWIPVLAIQFMQSKNSWIFPVDFQLIKAVLGNLFTGYEGTPGDLWGATFLLSLIILFFFYKGLKSRKRHLMILTMICLFAPLSIILGYSVFLRPIYVNRYVIFVTVYEIIGLSLAVWNIRNPRFRYLVCSLMIAFTIAVNIISPQFRKKTDFKTAFREINQRATNMDYAYAKTPIGFLETAYYFRNPEKVFVYNPKNTRIPNYIGVTVVFPNASKPELPTAPSVTYMIADDANYEIIFNR